MRYLAIFGVGTLLLATFVTACGDGEHATGSSEAGGRPGKSSGGSGGHSASLSGSHAGGATTVGGSSAEGGGSSAESGGSSAESGGSGGERCDDSKTSFVHRKDGQLVTAPLPGAGTRWMLAFTQGESSGSATLANSPTLVRIDASRKVTAFPVPNATSLEFTSQFSEFGDSYCYSVPQEGSFPRLFAIDLANAGATLTPRSVEPPSGESECSCLAWQSATDLVVKCGTNRYMYRPFASDPSEVGPRRMGDGERISQLVNPQNISPDGQLAVECTDPDGAQCRAFEVRRVTQEGTLGEVVYEDTVGYDESGFSPYNLTSFNWGPNSRHLEVASSGKYWVSYGVYDFSAGAPRTMVMLTGKMDYASSSTTPYIRGVSYSPNGRYMAVRVLRETPTEAYSFYDFATGSWREASGMPTAEECGQDSTDFAWLDDTTFVTLRCNVLRSLTMTDSPAQDGRLQAHPWSENCRPVELKSAYYLGNSQLMLGRSGENEEFQVQSWFFDGGAFTSNVITSIPRNDQATDNPSRMSFSEGVDGLFVWKENSLHLIVLDHGRVRLNVNLETLLGVDYDRTTTVDSLFGYAQSRFVSFAPDAVGVVDQDAATGQLRWSFLDSEPLGQPVRLDLPTATGSWRISFPSRYLRK